MNTPFFSIIIPTYNREETIACCVKSVLDQTFEMFEVIIIDNNSSDNTASIIESFHDNRIFFLKNDKNYERCFSRNRGIKNSKGKFILFLDSDDLYESNHLLNWYNVLQNQSHDKLFSVCKKKQIIDDKILLINSEKFPTNNEFIHKYIFDNVILPGQVCISKTIFDNDCFKFQSNYLIFEDTALWLQIASKNPPVFFEFDSFIYRVHPLNSVNWKKFNYGAIRVKSLKIFKKQNPLVVSKIGYSNFNKEISNSYFTTTKYFIYNRKNFQAIVFLLFSIIFFPSFFQLKHKLLLLFRLLVFSKKNEYKY